MDSRTRRAELQSWLLKQDISQQTIAEAVGISRQRVSCYLCSESLTRSIWDRFVEAGLPADLLPEPRELFKRGRKPRTGKLVRREA